MTTSGPPAPAEPMTARRQPGRGARPTRWAALLIGCIAVLTVVLPIGVLAPSLAVAAVAGCVAVDVVVSRHRRPAAARTAVPTLALSVPVPLEITAPVPFARSVRVRQPTPVELEVDPAESAGSRLSGRLTGVHRGVHSLPPAVVRATGPLGLGSCDHVVAATDTVTVLPDLPRARRMAAARRRGRASDEGRIRSRLGIGTEFETVRDYSPDDDVRQINWVATSRTGRPMSNQYRVEENRDLMCVLDTGRLMASPVDAAGPHTRLDAALDALTVLAVAAEEAGDRVGALAFGAGVTRKLDPRRRGAETVVRALFDLEPTEVESDYDRAFMAVGRRKRALVAVFTDLVDEGASRSLLGALPVLVRRHAVMIVSCRDPDLHATVTTRPHEVRDVLRAAVALRILQDHRRVVSLLRSTDATVVEAPPEHLGSACVRAYLTLKQRARL